MLAAFGSSYLVLGIEHMAVGVVVLEQVAFLMPVPHRASALDVEALHGFRQIDLAPVVLSFHFVLDLLKHLPHCCLHVLLCHQACAQLLGYDQRERHGCRLRLCRLRCGCRLRSLSRSAGLCFCCSCSALCCLDSSCSLRCVTFYH